MTFLELEIAKDFLKQLTPTKSISRYSPRASKLAVACAFSYPDGAGGVYPIRPSHLIEAAKALGLPVRPAADGDAQIGISAEQFSQRTVNAVFGEEFVCKHGFAPYSFKATVESGAQPQRVPCCKRCLNGLEAPSESDIAMATQWLTTGQSPRPPQSGALILASIKLGLTTSPPNGVEFKISKSK